MNVHSQIVDHIVLVKGGGVINRVWRMQFQHVAVEEAVNRAKGLLEINRRPEWSEAELQARSEVVGLLFEGLLTHEDDADRADRAALTDVLRSTMRHLLG